MLIGNSDIVELNKKGFNAVTEEDLRNILGRYALAESLWFLGTTSKLIYECWNGEKKTTYQVLGLGGIRNPATGAIVTQFYLAYIANIIITSRSNDWKSKHLIEAGKNNLEILSNVYNNCIFEYRRPGEQKTREEKVAEVKSILIRKYQEQLTLQFYFIDLIARNYVLFCKIAKDNPSYLYLSETFKKNTGLSIEDYFYIGLAIFALTITKEPLFRTTQLTDATVTDAHGRLSVQNVEAFLKIRSSDYQEFRKIDELKNAGQTEGYTKTRYNPLNQRPIIKIQNPIRDRDYVVPNYPLLVKGIFDLFWYFDESFSAVSNSEQTKFRNTFGEVFEDYVKKIIEHIYGTNKVKGEIRYTTPKGEVKFLDFYVEVGNVIYIFEAKANRFRLPTLQTGLETKLIDDEIKKFTKPILQIRDRFNDIPIYSELEYFRGKTLIPFVIFFDIPFVNDPDFYQEVLSKTDAGKEVIKTIEELGINCCNIGEFEKYAEHSDAISFEDIFKEIKKNPKGTSLISESLKHPHNLRELFLTKEFDEFKEEIMKIAETSYEEIKVITDAIYAGNIQPQAHLFIEVLNKYGIKLRDKDGKFLELTYSIPKSIPNSILIGIRYVKDDGSHTEDHFLFEQDKSIRRFYKNQIEKVLPEYKGMHKRQVPR